jgi:toxin HigB-1
LSPVGTGDSEEWLSDPFLTILPQAVQSRARVIWGKPVEKQLTRVSAVIVRKFRIWVALVEETGIKEVRKSKGFHDEPLKGRRFGQRSVRLNRAYRVIYVECATGEIERVEVLEVAKHEY